MALYPKQRAAGAVHVLRFVGPLLYQAPGATSQTVSGEVFPNPVAPGTLVNVRFLLAGSNIAATETRFPPSVLDEAWAQHLQVRAQARDNPSASELYRIDVLSPSVSLDGPPGSGLGLEGGTGLPVLELGFWFTADGIAALSGLGVRVVIEVEVPHTLVR